jgi:hypothetical protein
MLKDTIFCSLSEDKIHQTDSVNIVDNDIDSGELAPYFLARDK